MDRRPDLLTVPRFLPEGISVHRNNFAMTDDGANCIRVYIRHDATGLMTFYDVPIHKKRDWVRVSLFRWKEVEVTDHDRISEELRERGYSHVREITEWAVAR